MRLIDANALKLEYPKDKDWDYPVNTNSEVCETIDAQPTVDAIPVEWIESQVDKGKWAELVQRWAERKEE